jgi:hypothetical protein
MNRFLFGAFAVLLVFCSNVAVTANAIFANENNSNNLADLQEDMESLNSRIDHLERKVNTVPSRPNFFNPSITAFGNFITCFGQAGYPHGAHGLCESPFSFREAELDIRAVVDPYADAVLILAFEPAHFHAHDHDHVHTDEDAFQVEIEEAYITFKKIPFFNSAPLGLQLKAGRFRTPFGRFNQIHLHDLPQLTPASSLQAFLGSHGLMRNGFSAQLLIPTPGDRNSMSLTLQILDGGGLAFNLIDQTNWPAGLAHLSWFWDLEKGHDLELGLSAYLEHKPTGSNWPIQLYGVDANYKWRPFLFGDKHSFLFGGEIYGAPKEINTNEGGGKTVFAFGGFGFAQYQLNQWTYLGLRYDYRNLANNKEGNGHGVGAYLTYYTTEFLRLRVGYEVMGEKDFSKPSNNLLFEINFVFGSHPVEPYWVNR